MTSVESKVGLEQQWTRDKSRGLSWPLPLDKCATSWCLSGAFGCVASYNAPFHLTKFCEDLRDYLKLDVQIVQVDLMLGAGRRNRQWLNFSETI